MLITQCISLTQFKSPCLFNCVIVCICLSLSLSLKSCVKVFNRKVFNNRSDTPWRSVLGLSMDCRPEWRALYKPALPKRGGDNSWRILHGVIAVNAFISLVNPEISSDCPFCMQRETIFHAFMYCCRLRPLFNALETSSNPLMRIFLCKCLFVVLNM